MISNFLFCATLLAASFILSRLATLFAESRRAQPIRISGSSAEQLYGTGRR